MAYFIVFRIKCISLAKSNIRMHNAALSRRYIVIMHNEMLRIVCLIEDKKQVNFKFGQIIKTYVLYKEHFSKLFSIIKINKQLSMFNIN